MFLICEAHLVSIVSGRFQFCISKYPGSVLFRFLSAIPLFMYWTAAADTFFLILCTWTLIIIENRKQHNTKHDTENVDNIILTQIPYSIYFLKSARPLKLTHLCIKGMEKQRVNTTPSRFTRNYCLHMYRYVTYLHKNN